LEEFARKLDPYVEEGKIHSAKYNRKPAPFAKDSLVMYTAMTRKGRKSGKSQQLWRDQAYMEI
jgi:hypothetical protein